MIANWRVVFVSECCLWFGFCLGLKDGVSVSGLMDGSL